LQVSVKMRRYLHCFKGAKLAVFLCIALHIDEGGWAEPDVDLIKQETGYNKDTICTALSELCDLKIKGERVLLRDRGRGKKGRFGSNRYLIFPSADEVQTYEGPGPGPDSTRSDFPDMVEPDMVQPDMVPPDMVNPTSSLEEPVLQEEPVLEEPHTHGRTPALFAEPLASPGDAKRVCVNQDLAFADYLAYARSQRAIQNPEGWAMKHWPLRDADALILERRERKQADRQLEARASPAEDVLPIGVAGQQVYSRMQLGEHPAKIINELCVSAEVRALLFEKFCKPKEE
jgi:hypothetical protein